VPKIKIFLLAKGLRPRNKASPEINGANKNGMRLL
jgi:hypothetical protein